MKTKDLVIIALYSVIISISTQIKIPLGPIPMTLQVFTITLGALILTKKQILFSIMTFVFLTFIGISQTASSVSGAQIFVSLTFPYIIGFFVLSLVINKFKSVKGLVLGYVSFYTTALTILFIYLKIFYFTQPTILSVFMMGLVPFIFTDILSIGLAYIVSKRLNLNIR